MRKIWLALVLVATTAHTAHAGAALSGADDRQFPTRIEVEIDIRAQIEVTTMVLEFAPLAEPGDYVLTVPGPARAFATGVELDRGAGFAPAPMVGEAPPPSLGGSPASQEPAVADWLGTEPLRADLAELEAGPLTVRVRFQRLLRRYQGRVELDVGVRRSPLRSDGDPGAEVATSVRLATFRALDTLQVTGAGAQVDQQPSGATITQAGIGAATMHLLYAEDSSDIDVHLLTHRTPEADPLGGEAGYFLLIVDAGAAASSTPQPRTLRMVIDESGSMSGDKIAQAREAARAMLDHLGPEDAFDVLSFDDEVRAFAGAPVTASASNLEAAREFIKGISADGSTNLDEAIRLGLDGLVPQSAPRFDAMVLLSDGRATAGESDPVRIHDNALLRNPEKARIFTFSVGSDADLPLMEALARSNRGRHVDLNDSQATSELVDRARELFEDIRVVRLTDLELDLTGVGASELVPELMQDLFAGGQAVLVGRYQLPGTGSVQVRGDDHGAAFLRTIDVEAPALAADNEFIKYVWATEKVATLVADMSRGGDLQVLRDQITELGLAYRIQTPYTSFSTAPSGGYSDPYGGGGGGGGGGSAGYGAHGPVELALVVIMLGALVWRRRRRSA